MSLTTEEPLVEESPAELAQGNGHGPVPQRPVQKKNKSKRGLVLAVLAVVAVVAIIAGVFYWKEASKYESTDDAYVEGHVVPIGAQVEARVLAVHVTDNQMVHQGDLMIELDPTEYQLTLEQAQGSLEGMKGRLAQAQSQILLAKAQRDQAQAELESAKTNFDNADAQLKRYESLDPRARSKEQYDDATASQLSAKAQVDEATAKLAASETQIVTSQAAVASAQGDVDKAVADVHSAETDLSYCKILAPQDGRVTRKNVEPGAYITKGEDLLALVPSDVWVVANFKETQLDRMRPGDRVEISVDSYPSKTFSGTVDSIQAGTGSRFSMLPAENATGNFVKVVQRVPVKINFDPGQTSDVNQPLVPGMSVEPKVELK
jgi:membrane fusion protein (multidrug efflux system)